MIYLIATSMLFIEDMHSETILKIGYTVGRRDVQLLCDIISKIKERKNNNFKFNDQLEEIIRLIKVKYI